MLNRYRIERIAGLIEDYKTAYQTLLDTSQYFGGEELALIKKTLRDSLKKDLKEENRNIRYYNRRFRRIYGAYKRAIADEDVQARIAEIIGIEEEQEVNEENPEIEETEAVSEQTNEEKGAEETPENEGENAPKTDENEEHEEEPAEEPKDEQDGAE